MGIAEVIFKLNVSFINENDSSDEEVIGFFDNHNKRIDLVGNGDDEPIVKGFVPYSAIKKVEIIKQVGHTEKVTA